jgi:hypothetical protein
MERITIWSGILWFLPSITILKEVTVVKVSVGIVPMDTIQKVKFSIISQSQNIPLQPCFFIGER